MKIALIGAELEENLALRYIHAAVTGAGHEAAIFDFHDARQASRVVEDVAAFAPRIVGLSMVFTARAREFLSLADDLRRAGCRAHITAGGHFASFHAEELLLRFPAVDSILHGEGEEAMVDLAAHVERPAEVVGISCRDGQGRIVTTPQRPALDDLDRLAWPTRPAVFDHYLGVPITNILAGRGCYGDCSFCSINAWHRKIGGRRFRQRSLEDLTAEMAQLYHQRGVRIFNFHDDNFFLPSAEANLQRFGQWKRQLDAAGVGRIAIQVKARPDSVEGPVIDALREIGLFRVFLGVESNAVAGLRALGRGIAREQNRRALAILRGAGLHVTFNLLMFEPDCSLSDLRDNVAFIRQNQDVPQNFCGVVVYSGTPLERRLRAQGRLEGDLFAYNYRIADERCRLAYDIFRQVFTPRNFVLGGLNLQTMSVDYYLHILRHFYPRLATPSLAAKAKDFISRVNGNNAELLDEILAMAQRPGAGEKELADFTEGMIARRERFDRKLARQCEDLLSRMRAKAAGAGKPRRGLVSSAATAAAMLALSGTHCTERAPEDPYRPAPLSSPEFGTHATEIVPPPPPPPPPTSRPYTHMSEMAPGPPPLAPAPTRIYVVKKGDTLTNIARTELGDEYRVKFIMMLNPGLDPDKLAVGQKILIPAHGDASQPSLRPAVPPPTHRMEMASDQPMIQAANPANGPSTPASSPTQPAGKPASQAASKPASMPAVEPYTVQQAQEIQNYLQKQYGEAVTALVVQHMGTAYAGVPIYLELDGSGMVQKFRIELTGEQFAKFKTALELEIVKWKVPGLSRAGSCKVSLLTPARPPRGTYESELAPRAPLD